MQERVQKPPSESDGPLALLVILFCIACIALMGIVCSTFVYWDLK